MKPTRLRLAVKSLPLLLLIWMAGCGPRWTALNRAGLQADLREVLGSSLGGVSLTDCQMIGATRSGHCSLDLDREGARALAEGLGLTEGTVDLESLAGLPTAAEGRLGCLSGEAIGPVDGLPAYWIGGRPEVLALHSGGQFEYLLLILQEPAGKACVQVSYAYG